MLKILKIIPDTVVDGPGLRTSIYFAGCKLHCKGCHNPESWDFNQGVEYTPESLLEEIKKYKNNKVTLTGGNPVDQEDQESLIKFCKLLKENGYDVWLYSGYYYDKIPNQEILKYVDYIVDGPFIEELKGNDSFKGSINQRYIKIENGNNIIFINCIRIHKDWPCSIN